MNRFLRNTSIIEIIISFILIFLFIGCETTLPFGNSSEQLLAITAIGTNDEKFTLKLTDVRGLGESTFLFFYNDNPQVYDESDTLSISNANVVLTVNDTQTISLKYNHAINKYSCDYVVQEGDVLAIDATCDGYKDAHAVVKIPTKQKIEVVDYTIKYSKLPFGIIMDNELLVDQSGIDSIVSLQLRFKDPENEKNFYRLRIRTGAENNTCVSYLVSDIFTSNDIIFENSQITEPYNGWPAYFFNVFDDSKIDGKEYTFNVELRLRYGYISTRNLCIDFESITEELYMYLLAERKHQISYQGVYGESVFMPSNIQNGFGVLGGLSGERILLYI